MSRNIIVASLFASSILAWPRQARASDCYVTWDCNGSAQCAQVYGASSGSRSVDSCAGFIQRDQVSQCTCGGPAQAVARYRSPEAALVSLHLVGALAGGLLGTFFQSPNGQSYWAEGAVEGAGVLGLAALAFNFDKISTPAAVAVAAVDGALIGGGYAHYRAVEFVQPGMQTPSDETVRGVWPMRGRCHLRNSRGAGSSRF